MRAQNNLGVIYRDRGRFEEAISSFEAALQGDPESVATLNNLGLAYASIARYEEGIAMFKRAVDIDDRVPEVWLNLGLPQRVAVVEASAMPPARHLPTSVHLIKPYADHQ